MPAVAAELAGRVRPVFGRIVVFGVRQEAARIPDSSVAADLAWLDRHTGLLRLPAVADFVNKDQYKRLSHRAQ